MKTLALTGWQQRGNALLGIAPNAQCFSYSSYPSVEAAFAALPYAPKLAIGWSLGGQLLVRAIAAGRLKPETLLLISAPFQCVGDADFPLGMSREDFDGFEGSYRADPKATLGQFNALVGLGDAHGNDITRQLDAVDRVWDNGAFWLNELGRFSCRGIDFSAFPKTILVHGLADKIIDPANAEAFREALPQCEVHLWKDCAHAPHLHNAAMLQAIVKQHV